MSNLSKFNSTMLLVKVQKAFEKHVYKKMRQFPTTVGFLLNNESAVTFYL